jgi:hypothetical protein
VIAYDWKLYLLLVEQVTAARVRAHFAGVVEGDVVRYELPGIGKSLSSALLELEIEAPADKT